MICVRNAEGLGRNMTSGMTSGVFLIRKKSLYAFLGSEASYGLISVEM